MSQTKMLLVPYKGGAPAMTALLGGEVQVNFATSSTGIPHIRSGKLRGLAVTGAKRSTAIPELPTVTEAGVKGYQHASWVGMLAPANTPKAIVDRLNAEVQKTLKDKGVAEKLTSQTLDPMLMSPEQFAARLKSDYDKYAKVIKDSGAKAD